MPTVLKAGGRFEEVRVQPLKGRAFEVTTNDGLMSAACPAMISVANLHSIRLTTPQNTQIGSIEGGRSGKISTTPSSIP